jgi:hypothetical protein
MEEERQYIFLSDYYNYSRCVTFTEHLFDLLRKKYVLLLTKKFEENARGEFGYGIHYQNISVEALDAIQYLFVINKKIRTKVSISLSVSKIEFYFFHWNTKQNEKIL